MTPPTSNIQTKLEPWFKQSKSCYVPGLSFDEYASRPGLNASLLKKPTAAHMRHELMRTEEKLSYAFALGEAFHKAVLEPDLFDGDGMLQYFQYSPTAGIATKAAREALAADPTRPIVTPEIIDKARYLRDAVYCHRFASKLLRGESQRELSGFAWDEENQVMRKIRVDFLPGGPSNFLVDLKMTRSVDAWKFRKSVREFGYGLAAAYYLDTHRMISGQSRELFYLIAAEGPTGANDDVDGAPYLARVFEVNAPVPDDSLVVEGRELYEDRMAMFLQAAHDNAWDGFQHEEAVALTRNVEWKK
jgi:hypothetical protein